MDDQELSNKIENKEIIMVDEVNSIPIYTYSEYCKDRESLDGGKISLKTKRIIIDRDIIVNKDLYDFVIFHEYGHFKDTGIPYNSINGGYYEEARFYYLKTENEPYFHELFADWYAYLTLGKNKAIRGLSELRKFIEKNINGYELKIREIDLRINIMKENYEGYEFKIDNVIPE